MTFDLPLLGDVSGARGVHLQCHIGTDTISLARLGAVMTGLDFSGASVAEARRFSALAGTPVDFVQCDVYDALDVLRHGLRPRLHGSRCAVLAARHPGVGAGGVRAAPTGRPPLHP